MAERESSSSAAERCAGDRMSKRLTMRKIRKTLRLHEACARLLFKCRVLVTHLALESAEVEMRREGLPLVIKMLSQVARLPAGPNIRAPSVVLTRAEDVQPSGLCDLVVVLDREHGWESTKFPALLIARPEALSLNGAVAVERQKRPGRGAHRSSDSRDGCARATRQRLGRVNYLAWYVVARFAPLVESFFSLTSFLIGRTNSLVAIPRVLADLLDALPGFLAMCEWSFLTKASSSSGVRFDPFWRPRGAATAARPDLALLLLGGAPPFSAAWTASSAAPWISPRSCSTNDSTASLIAVSVFDIRGLYVRRARSVNVGSAP